MRAYKSPIEIICQGIGYEVDKGILKAVLEHGINVDKDELIRALQYDRDQYKKGYSDGKKAAMDELVWCKDCKHSSCNPVKLTYACNHPLGLRGFLNEGFYFCSHGERREGE